jgi:hypothetical protein
MNEPLFHIGLAQVLAGIFNFAGLIALVAMLVMFVRGNRRLALRWLGIFVVCVSVGIGLVVLGAEFAG